MNHKTVTRLLSLDVFRGITIAVMILVNSPGNQFAYSWLEHSVWDGCTLADLVFPFFIVIVGMSSVFALTNLKIKGFSNRQLLKEVIKRSVYIFSMGLLLNILPNHFDFSHIRVLGVLQRIAICYFFSSILFLTTKIRNQVIIVAVILIVYWFLMSKFPSIGPLSIDHNLVGYLDQLILSSSHLYTPLFDPEGLLSTLPAIASALLGNIMGIILISSGSKREQACWISILGLSLSALGWVWSGTFPINKLLWSSSYVLWTGGLSFLSFALCFALIEIKHVICWSKPFLLLGKHAMLIYLLHIFFLKIQAIILVHNAYGDIVNLRFYITDLLFHPFPIKMASLCYAIGYTLFWLFIVKCISQWRLRSLHKQLAAN